jgi:superfamily I DNA/RNA helicase
LRNGFRNVEITSDAAHAATKHGNAVAAALLMLREALRVRPDSKGVDFESYRDSLDAKFRTARLNDQFRALIWQIDGESLLIWDVATHEQAAQASRRKECRVNALTRELELRTVSSVDGADGVVTATNPSLLLPSTVSDPDLRHMGLSNDLIAVVRATTSYDALEALARLLPGVTKQLFAVRLLAEGESAETVYGTLATTPDDPPNLTDYHTALVRSVRNGRLAVLASEAEVSAALTQPWESWKIFLHPDQQKIATAKTYNGPTRVVGGPGTGKTVVAIHRARFLASEMGFLGAAQSILVTTFVTTMADQLSELVEALLGQEQASKVRVTNIDKIVMELLKTTDYRTRGFKVLTQSSALDARIESLGYDMPAGMSVADVRRWWENVYLGMLEPTWDDYQRLRKSVRGFRQLSEPLFAQLLRLTAALESCLETQRETTFLLRVRECLSSLPEDATRFQHVVVDEAQDLHPLHWRLLRRLVPTQVNDIFLVGDADQRLYRTPFPLAYSDIILNNRSKRLEKSYRCSVNILTFANRILFGVRAADPDGDETPLATSVFSGPEPECFAASDLEKELRTVVNRLKQWRSNGVPWGEMLVMCPTKARGEEVLKRLTDAHIAACRVGEEGTAGPDVVRVTTTHRAKGMEANVAVVCGVGSTEFGIDGLSEEEVQQRRHVLFVACTRARQELHVSWVGEPSVLLRSAVEARPGR